MSCEFTTLDAAYVLGSLAPAERADFERHLRVCEECARSVRELAGLPGLLACVPADVLELSVSAEREPVPATLLPGMVAAAERKQRRRTTRTALFAAAAVAVIAGGSAVVAASLGDDESPMTSPPAAVETTAPPQRMTPVGHGESTGWVSLTPIEGWGTRLDLTCEYRSTYGGSRDADTYQLVIRTADGRLDLKPFEATPGEEVDVSMETAIAPDDIKSVEVRKSNGDAILRLTN